MAPHADAWKAVEKIRKDRLKRATGSCKLKAETDEQKELQERTKRGTFAERYEAMRAWFNPQVPLEFALPMYCDTDGNLVMDAPGGSRDSDKEKRKRWSKEWQTFYEAEVQPILNNVKVTNDARVAQEEAQKALAAGEPIAPIALEEVQNVHAAGEPIDPPASDEFVISMPDASELAELAYEQQRETIDMVMIEVGVHEKVRLLSELLLRYLEPTLTKDTKEEKAVCDALEALEDKREDLPPEEREVFVQACMRDFVDSGALDSDPSFVDSIHDEMASNGGAGPSSYGGAGSTNQAGYDSLSADAGSASVTRGLPAADEGEGND